jgi:DNA-directed RNA polymerase specialized sigma subunit
MYTLKKLTEKMLTEKEALVYLAVENRKPEDTLRTIGEQLGMSHMTVSNIYEKAKKKVKELEKLGVL